MTTDLISATSQVARKWLQSHGRLMTAALFGMAVCGCMVGPDYHRPHMDVPQAWTGQAPAPAAPPAGPAELSLARWWLIFNDPVLSALIDEAVQSNLDLKLAAARIRQARAALRGAVSFLGPTLDSNAFAQHSRSPGFRGSTNKGDISNQYQAGFDAAWEIDVFGGVRRNIEAADADLAATVEALQNVLVSLTAEVALNYIDLRSFQQRVSIARKNLATQTHSAHLTRLRFEAGFVSGLDVANAEAQVAATASTIPLLESAAQQSIYNISILLGRDPAALLPELSPPKDIPEQPPAVPLGQPTNLLLRRPDIRQAEAQVHAATARIGVATADLFPRFTILGSAGLQSTDFSSWLTWSSRFWSFGPSASWNLFSSGRTLANIEQQRAEQTLVAYRQTVLTALQEVENALIASTKEQEHRVELSRAVTYNRKAVDLATQLYTQGQTDFLSVLDAQRSLFLTEDQLAASTGTVLTDLISLYKALGGGWGEETGEARETYSE
jgi:multidrug efflux system outer membrane protein